MVVNYSCSLRNGPPTCQRMSSLTAKVTALEQARANVARLELELAIDLGIAPAEIALLNPPPKPRTAPKQKRPQRSHITPAMKRRVIKYTERGWDKDRIARKVGISPASVTNVRRESKTPAA